MSVERRCGRCGVAGPLYRECATATPSLPRGWGCGGCGVAGVASVATPPALRLSGARLSTKTEATEASGGNAGSLYASSESEKVRQSLVDASDATVASMESGRAPVADPSAVTVECDDYHAHQSHHRQTAAGFTCDACRPPDGLKLSTDWPTP